MAHKTLLYIGWRYLIRRPWQSILMILGIALGVAVVVAVDLANASARRGFDLSAEAVAGKSTHQISGGSQGLDEALYTRLRRAGLGIPMAPVVDVYVSSPRLGEGPFQLLGVDPFAEGAFRSYFGSGNKGYSGNPAEIVGSTTLDLTTFLTQPGAVLISSDLAQTYNLDACPSLESLKVTIANCQLQLDIGGRTQTAFVAGLLQPVDDLSRRALQSLILADMATAQELTGRYGTVDHIDMILPEGMPGEDLQRRIKAMLPPEAQLNSVGARSGAVAQMTAAFRVNLTALSMLALVVGMFLIYNTVTFSVVQRRALFGTLRCLGVTRREVFALVMSEALLISLLGAVLGMALGLLMGQGAVSLVTQTINDLFYVVTVRGVQIPVASLAKGGLLGVIATLLTAAPPAWEAASVSPRAALARSLLEGKARKAIWLAAVGGLTFALGGGALLMIPTRSLLVSFAGNFAVIVGFALFTPLSTGWLMRASIPFLGRIWGTLGRMAPRDVANSLSRTSIAVMALMVAVSVTIGVSLMVSSFRSTVITWLSETLQGDVYISVPGPTASTPSTAIDPGIVEAVKTWPGVARVDVLRSVEIDSPQGMVEVAATDNFSLGDERIFQAIDVSKDQIWARLLDGSVIVSEPLANRLGIPRHGGSLTLYTANGPRSFPVVGIYYDYASSQGTVLMALPLYRDLWEDDSVTAVALRLGPGVDADQVAHAMQTTFVSRQQVLVRPNQALRQEVLVIFDRTFAITGALQLLATVVAFIGVLSSLLSLELERQRELGILRAVGLTVRQLWSLIMLETGLMGAAAGLLSMPTGYVLALILVYIINRRSFGWTLQMQVQASPFLQALAIAVTAALIAGIYPALRMGRMLTSEALRSE
jgi:putative ABC transport system permease protein